MKYVSCRKNFSDQNEFNPKGLTTIYGDSVPESGEFIQVHGYNCGAEDVMDAYRSNKEMMHEANWQGKVTGFLWPGLGENWVESLEFHKAQKMADESGKCLAAYLDCFKEGDAPVSIMTHSLGARVTLEAILRTKAKINLLALTGAAVEEDELATKYSAIKDKVAKVHVYWSTNDHVLSTDFKLDQRKIALGHSGPKTKLSWVKDTDVSYYVHKHSGYRHERTIWKEIVESL